MRMTNCLPLIVLSAVLFGTESANGQCAIHPIKPIPPLGCKDVRPECVSNENGESHWTWICVRDDGTSDSTGATTRRRSNGKNVTVPSDTGEANHTSAPIPPDGSAEPQPPESVEGQSPKEEITEQWAKSEIDQIRSIVQRIKRCDAISTSDRFGKRANVTAIIGIPFNVTWDVARSSSMRAPYSAYIQVVIGHRMDIDSECIKNINCLEMQSHFNSGPATINRYEFDLSQDGLAFQRKLSKKESESKWIDDQQRGWCWDKIVSSLEAEK